MSTGQRAGYFYPRSPCGERPFCASFQLSSIPISIHALLAESDAHKRLCAQRRYNFYPRSPCGERRVSTRIDTGNNIDFYPRSPCGERQWHLTKHPQHKLNFYPRSPCGERPSNINSSSIIAYFYPRSPCGERPASGFLSDTSDVISIHALLAESDEHAYQLVLWVLRFLSTLSLRRATF